MISKLCLTIPASCYHSIILSSYHPFILSASQSDNSDTSRDNYIFISYLDFTVQWMFGWCDQHPLILFSSSPGCMCWSNPLHFPLKQPSAIHICSWIQWWNQLWPPCFHGCFNAVPPLFSHLWIIYFHHFLYQKNSCWPNHRSIHTFMAFFMVKSPSPVRNLDFFCPLRNRWTQLVWQPRDGCRRGLGISWLSVIISWLCWQSIILTNSSLKGY